MDDAVLTNSIRTTQLHSDTLGEWVVIDDGADHSGVLAVPAGWERRELLSRDEVEQRFAAINNVPVELDGIRGAYEALRPLSDDARARAMRWLMDRFEVSAAEPVPVIGPAELHEVAPAGKDARKLWLHGAWNADRPIADIAAALGLTEQGARQMVYRMRREGWDMPQRRRRPHGVV